MEYKVQKHQGKLPAKPSMWEAVSELGPRGQGQSGRGRL